MTGHDQPPLRLLAVFLMGITVGICLMLVYMTVRSSSLYPAPPSPAAEVDR